MADRCTVDLDLDYLRTWIGRESSATDIVSADLVRKFRATFDLKSEVVGEAEVAPRLIHFCLAQEALFTIELGEDGHGRKGKVLPPVPLPRRMWAGGSITVHGDLLVGDTVERKTRIIDVVAKQGRSGIICFVTLEHTILVKERMVVSERQDIVYRSASPVTSVTMRSPEQAANGQHVRRIKPTSALLFRYSALTFNGHRIHYDRNYAAGIEGYPGLVVHGPLQASLLYNFAAQLRDSLPSRFVFRSSSPLFDTEDFWLHADVSESGLKLWTAREGGPVAMAAEAGW